MSNLVDSFSSYNQFNQYNAQMNPMYHPTAMYRCAYPSGTRSPNLEELEGMFSPMCCNQNSFGKANIQVRNTNSPIIQLRPCYKDEDSIEDSEDKSLMKNSPMSKNGRCKLNSNSRAFVLGQGLTRKDSCRKTSQDTKAHSDEEGNSTDGSEDYTPNSYFIKKTSKKTEVDVNMATQNSLSAASDEKPVLAKFKTELCKNWQTGTCKFGSKCAFAHGSEELTEKKHLPSNYKTKVCKQFHEELYCSYGERCQFIHLVEAPSVKDNTLCSAINSLAGLNPSRKSNKNRLAIFKSLAN